MQTQGSSNILVCQSDADVDPVLLNMTLCRSVRVNQSFGETFYFRLLLLETHRTADVYITLVGGDCAFNIHIAMLNT